jgi:hypothetical protein
MDKRIKKIDNVWTKRLYINFQEKNFDNVWIKKLYITQRGVLQRPAGVSPQRAQARAPVKAQRGFLSPASGAVYNAPRA